MSGEGRDDTEALVVAEARRRMAWSLCVRVHDLAPGYVAGCCVCQQWADALTIATPDALAAAEAAGREQVADKMLALAREWDVQMLDLRDRVSKRGIPQKYASRVYYELTMTPNSAALRAAVESTQQDPQPGVTRPGVRNEARPHDGA